MPENELDGVSSMLFLPEGDFLSQGSWSCYSAVVIAGKQSVAIKVAVGH